MATKQWLKENQMIPNYGRRRKKMENVELKQPVEVTEAKKQEQEVVEKPAEIAEEEKEEVVEDPAPKKKRFEKGKVNCLLRLREESNVDAKILLNMPKDSILRIDLAKSTEYFYYVVFKDPEINKDVTGFAMKDFITLIK